MGCLAATTIIMEFILSFQGIFSFRCELIVYMHDECRRNSVKGRAGLLQGKAKTVIS
jgi:hypothetical protein